MNRPESEATVKIRETLETGLNVEIPDRNGMRPLHHAVAAGRHEAAAQLLTAILKR